MQTFTTKRAVAHSATQMFDLVADIENYPKFLPLCQGLRVTGRSERGGFPVLTADMTVAYKVFHETFASRITLDRPNLTITVEYLNGPFRHLENRWVFVPRGEGACEVDFYIAWELRSRTLAMIVGAVFERVFKRYAEAFEQRADQVYGRAPRKIAV